MEMEKKGHPQFHWPSIEKIVQNLFEMLFYSIGFSRDFSFYIYIFNATASFFRIWNKVK